jgi:hypothetical protein
MTAITMSGLDIYSNKTTTPIPITMDKNQSAITTTTESTSLDDLCKNFHVGFNFIINLNNYIHQS